MSLAAPGTRPAERSGDTGTTGPLQHPDLEHPGPARGRRRHRHWDAAAVLSGYVAAIIGLPSEYVIGPLGGAGGVAQVLGMACFGWWVLHRLAAPTGSSTAQPVRRAALLLAIAFVASAVAGATRPLGIDDRKALDLALLVAVSWFGVFLVAHDGITDSTRLVTLLRRLVAMGGALATLGLLQFRTGMTFVEYLQLPGLTQSSELGGIGGRDGFLRPAGTALHPIEFGVVLTTLLPLALYFAMNDRGRRPVRRWYPVAAIALAVPVSVSRSAIVCVAVGFAVLLPTWSRRQRRLLVVALGGLGAVVFVTVPGMLGTLLGLFTGIGNDTSAASRTDSYGTAFTFIGRSPAFGRGLGTFLPRYRILDNQYLLSTVEIGIVGAAALLGLLVTAILTARWVRRHTDDPALKALAQAVAASVAAAAAAFALFDALSFPMISGLVFLLCGCAGALRQVLLHAGQAAAVPAADAVRLDPVPPRAPVPGPEPARRTGARPRHARSGSGASADPPTD